MNENDPPNTTDINICDHVLPKRRLFVASAAFSNPFALSVWNIYFFILELSVLEFLFRFFPFLDMKMSVLLMTWNVIESY